MAQKKKKKATKKREAAAVPTEASASSGRTLLATDPHLTREEKEVVRAVKDFEASERTIALFEQEHEDVMSTYRALMEEREQKRQKANGLVRSLDVSCGPWDRFTTRTTYDETELVNAIGMDKFLEIGGTVGTTTVYSIDGKRIEMAIASGVVPPQAIAAVKKVVPNYHAPDPS